MANAKGSLLLKGLIEKGVDATNAIDKDGQMALGGASFKGHLEIVKELIEAGAE